MEARVYPDLPEPEWEWGVARLFPPRGEWTEEDYLNLPDNQRVELSEGCLEFLPVPNEEHQLILGYLYEELAVFVRARKLGMVLMAGIPVRLWEGKMRQPDVVFRSADRPRSQDRRYWDGADLAVEIVSPDGRQRDLVEKRDEYARSGIREYWIVDPKERSIEVLALDGDTYRLAAKCGSGEQAASRVLAGWVVSVDAVFAAADVE